MKLWGGRFTEGVNELVNTFNSSISIDSRMYKEDIEGSIAHVKMLGKQGIIPLKDSEKIIDGLKEILIRIDSGTINIDNDSEDIHSFIESILTYYIGDEGKKLHTGRSRNDQVTLDTKLYLRKYIKVLINEIFAENRVKIKQFFSPATYYILNQLNKYGLVNNIICEQLEDIKNFSVVACSINIGVDFNNIANYVEAIKDINPDFVILQTGIRFCEYETAKQMLQFGCSSSLDLIIKSHYNNVTLDDVKIYYCNNQIEVDGFINDIENINLKEELEFKIFSKLSLPKGISRI